MKKIDIYYLGDIHGNFNVINQFIKLYNIENAHIIQVGDFGVGFKSIEKETATRTIIKLKKSLKLYLNVSPFNCLRRRFLLLRRRKLQCSAPLTTFLFKL